jgi:hypothetical protein
MRLKLAERLLVETMGWKPEQVSKERALIQAMADFKYDEYQQFSPGIRYVESLVRWLKQFQTVNERQIAYNFVKDQLIFFSNDQITHLVNITYADKINPVLMGKTASVIKMNPLWVRKIFNSTTYKVLLRRSLFIGLSDGSKIDQLRRSNGRISNEQVLSTYSISEEKVADMLKELKKSKIKDHIFNTIFLIDDFTASGTSYFRKGEKGWGGKIFKFLSALFIEKSEISKLVNDVETEVIELHIIFYVATQDALNRLNSNIKDFLTENPAVNIIYSVEAIQIIGDVAKEKVLQNIDFVDLIRKYYDSSINDSHYQMGKHDEPYLGFNECCLPLILNHNTPNNSLPILWFPEDKAYTGLFPRVTRHKDE